MFDAASMNNLVKQLARLPRHVVIEIEGGTLVDAIVVWHASIEDKDGVYYGRPQAQVMAVDVLGVWDRYGVDKEPSYD